MTSDLIPYLFLALSAVGILFYGLSRQSRASKPSSALAGYSMDNAAKRPMDHYLGPWD